MQLTAPRSVASLRVATTFNVQPRAHIFRHCRRRDADEARAPERQFLPKHRGSVGREQKEQNGCAPRRETV
jgi:hypothetical protein